MHPVSEAFLEAISAPERQTLGRVVIDYTDPLLDQSLSVSTNEHANVSYPDQTADGVTDVPHKWASLDGSWVLDGTYHLAPGSADADRYQFGWWSEQLAGAGGAFTSPHPTLTVVHQPRPVHSLSVAGDNARLEYPVDFTIRLYSEADTLLHTETVTGNGAVSWSKPLAVPVLDVARQELEVTRWSHVGRQAKIIEFFTSVQQTYLSGDLLGISLLEEREVSQGSLPVGSISANEITIRIRNDDRRFAEDNEQSPLRRLLVPNRRIRAELGVRLPDDDIEWVPLGTFWSLDWDAPDDTVVASVVARDRLELLRKSTYQTSQVLTNIDLCDLATSVLTDAGLQPHEFMVCPSLAGIVVPYAWFEPVSHREALRLIAEAALGTVYCARDGRVVVHTQFDLGAVPVAAIGPDKYFRANSPARYGEVANEIIVDTQPLRPVPSPEEVYRSNEPVTVPAGQTANVTVHYNQRPVIDAAASLTGATATVIQSASYYGWGAELQLHNPSGMAEEVTVTITGKPLRVLNRERAIARDEASITELGVLRYELEANPLIQTREVAQQLADLILASASNPRRDLDMDWRGNPALVLGDRITVKGTDYHIIRQQIDWNGGLRMSTTGRRTPD